MAVGAAAAIAARPSAAQTPPLTRKHVTGAVVGAEATNVTVDDYERASVTGLRATFWGTSDRASGSVTASLSRFETAHGTTYVGAQGALRLAESRTTIGTWDADAGAGAYRGRGASAYVTTGPRIVQRVRASTRLWVAGGVGRAGDVATYGTMDAAAGAAVRQRGVDGATVVTLVHAPNVTYGDLTGSLAWTPQLREGTGIALESAGLTGGVRTGDRGPGVRQWLQQLAVVRIVPSVALVLANGSAPPDLLRAARGVRYTSAGIQLRFGASSARRPEVPVASVGASARFAVSGPAADGTRSLAIRMRDVTNLEITGDFTAWRSVRMTRVGGDVWIVRLPLAPGVHHANVRTPGGEWETIPTLPAAAGDFGAVSVFVVP